MRFKIVVQLFAIFIAPHLLSGTENPIDIPALTIKSSGTERTCFVHLPKGFSSKKVYPLVFILHGGGGNALQVAGHSQFNKLADKYGFIVAYPQGINKHWNDGRKVPKHREQDSTINDIEFIMKSIEAIKRKYPVNSSRIYAAGISNGGFMCQRLAVEKANTFAAVASIVASLPLRWQNSSPGEISVLLINGTSDPLVPYNGGPLTIKILGIRLDQGKVLSTDKTIYFWLKHNKISTLPVITDIEDKVPNDNCHAVRFDWSNKESGVCVSLIKVINGGHSWPGAEKNLPKRIVGETCDDFNASEVIWSFFKDKHLIVSPGRNKEIAQPHSVQ